MNPPFFVEALSPDHDRAGFESGVAALDRYLRAQASQDVRRHVSNCFVARETETGALAGYYTFSAASLPLSEIPQEEARRLPRYPILPAAIIGRLAVDRRFAGRGLGGALVLDACRKAAGAQAAIHALLVDAKDDAAVAFYRHLGFRPFVSRPMSLFLPLRDIIRRLEGRPEGGRP